MSDMAEPSARFRPASDPLAPALAALHGEGRLRVWSLVITVFGDAVEPRGGSISTARLMPLMARLGVESGAVRTALSRLAGDGWLGRMREGRTSRYGLTARGRAEFAPATRAVYAAPLAPGERAWVMATSGPSQAMAPERARPLAPGQWLWPEGPGREVPQGWLAVRGMPEGLTTEAAALAVPEAEREARRALAREARALASVAPDLDPLAAMGARTLLVHRWRRLVLRYPGLPPGPISEMLDLPDCRALVARAYAALLPGSERWLDAPVTGGDAPMPAPAPGFARRFGGLPGAGG